MNTAGAIVWQYPPAPEQVAYTDAERLPNGNTLIAEIVVNRVIEVNSAGTIIWEKTGLNHALDAEGFFTEPPNTPSIVGSEEGKAETLYPYTFVANDLEGEIVFYYIDWGDGTYAMGGPVSSGSELSMVHTWASDGTYEIKVKAIDQYGANSDWATLTVKMPLRPQTLLERIIEWILQIFNIPST